MLNFTSSQLEINLTKYVMETHKLIEYRNHQIAKGFIYKGYEECSFNEFYSNGNENILKYAGIINGLQKTNADIFMNLPEDISNKMKVIIDISRALIENDDNHLILYNKYFRAAKYCMVACSDEIFLYSNLYSKKDLINLIEMSRQYNVSVEKENMILNQKIIEVSEKYNRQLSVNKRVLDNTKNLKRNAYYSVKKLESLLEKMDSKNDGELKAFYSSKVKHQQEELKVLNQLMVTQDEISIYYDFGN